MSGARFKVLVTDKVAGPALGALKDDKRFEVVLVDDSKDPKFLQELATAHGLIVRSATKVKADMLAKAPALGCGRRQHRPRGGDRAGGRGAERAGR